ncbi:MAG: hypothetical protein KZQ91_05025 [Candidatus Thiodiazotropha sp. (ex Lucinoma borealis)]|nr:hypothetical protein [Candidatus Thiodiazotropha sp. (ex Lucinoma borealis)]
MTPHQLAAHADVDYYAARRFLQVGVKNKTSNAVKLCESFAISLDKAPKVQTQLLEVLSDVLKDTWDGSEPHAILLTELIKSTKHFKIVGRS